MKYLKTFHWRATSCNDFIATSDTAEVEYEYRIKINGYKFQLKIKHKIDPLDESCIDFCRLHDAMQFAYEHHLKRNNF